MKAQDRIHYTCILSNQGKQTYFFPSALESRTVSVFIPAKKYGDDMDQQLSFPIQCNFWALADSASPSKRTARCDNVVLGSVVGSYPTVFIVKWSFFSGNEMRMLFWEFYKLMVHTTGLIRCRKNAGMLYRWPHLFLYLGTGTRDNAIYFRRVSHCTHLCQ